MEAEMPKLPPPETASTVAPAKKRGWPAGMCRAHKKMNCSECANRPKTKKSVSAVVQEEKRKVEPATGDDLPSISNEEVGKVFSGVFMLTSLPMGPHWRLYPHEATELGNCFGPIFRRYPEKVGPWLDLLMCGPAVAAVVVPRIGVQQLIGSGDVRKEDARDALRVLLAYSEQEKQSAIASLADEQAKFAAARKAAEPSQPQAVENVAT